MRTKNLWLVIVVAVAAVGVVAWLVWQRSALQAMALLELLPPGAEFYAVADVQGLQSNPALRKLLSDPPVLSLEEEYKQFLQGTGFRYQDHLQQLAVAKLGTDWVGAARVELDRARVAAYLESQGASRSQEAGQTVYAFGSARPFRLVFLEDQLVAFTAGADSSHLRQVLEQHSKNGADSGASELRRSGELELLPAGSELRVWGRLDRLLEETPSGPSIGPFQLGRELLQGSRTLYLSVESGPLTLEMRAEDRCDSAASAERIARWVEAILTVLRTPAPLQSPAQRRNWTPLWAALRVRQAGESVFLNWRWNPSMLAVLEQGAP